MVPPGLSDKVAECTLGLFDMDSSACDRYHGYVRALSRGHEQDCVWSGSSCDPYIVGLDYVKPPPE